MASPDGYISEEEDWSVKSLDQTNYYTYSFKLWVSLLNLSLIECHPLHNFKFPNPEELEGFYPAADMYVCPNSRPFATPYTHQSQS
jgi:hypothetical protein